jgi:class 3 adenylate cyclase
MPLDASAALAAAIPNAQFLTILPGEHHAFDVVDVLAAEILTFCERPAASRSERTLATVLITDIVGSAEQLSAVGDEHGRHQLDVHDRVADTLLAKYGGVASASASAPAFTSASANGAGKSGAGSRFM